MPFGRPRDVEAVRADPRFAELRAHIWRQLHTRGPRACGPRRGSRRVMSVEIADRSAPRRRASEDRERAPEGRGERGAGAASSRTSRSASSRSPWCWRCGRCFGARVDPVLFTTPCGDREGRRGDDRQRRIVDLSVAEPRRARARPHRSRRSSASPSGCCWRGSGCSTSRSASTSPSSIRPRRWRWCR